jgi:hypothetical protein
MPETLAPGSVGVGGIGLRTVALAALAERAVDALDDRPEGRFLREQLLLGSGGATWREMLDRLRRHPAAADVPLLTVGGALTLSRAELLAVALCAAVEDDVMAGRAVAYLQAPLGGSRPTVGLLAVALTERPDGAADACHALTSGAAVGSGLLTLAAEPVPLPERTMAVPLHLARALAARDATVPGVTIGIEGGADVMLPASFDEDIRTRAGALLADPAVPLVIRAASAAEGRSVARALAAAMGRRPAFITAESVPGLGPWALLRGLLPVFCAELSPGERRTLAAIAHYRGPIVALCGPDGMVESATGPATSWTLPVPPRAEREALWGAAVGDEALARTLATDHRHGAGRIFHLGRLARHHALTAGRSSAAH